MANVQENLIVTLSGTHPANRVAEDLQRNGFKVHSILDTIGVITGDGDSANLADLQSVPGVADVSPNHTIDIGPPGPDTL